MLARVRKMLRRIAIAIGIVIATIFLVRSFDAWRSPPLKLWHTQVPHELDADEIDAADWEAWVVAENSAFAELQREVIDALPADDQIPINRYFAASPINPLRFAQNWNHSFVLTPVGTPRGAVVLLHGLTDSPFSMRHIALRYVEHGYVAVAVRMPGHGTVPAGLTTTRWEAWLAATRLAVRTARAMAGDKVPLHMVGYSNGGALTLKYALDSLSDPKLARPDRLVLLSPMVGITSFARFAGVLGWPAAFPSFAKAAWLDVLPEYNPFKYNSFPVNAARQIRRWCAPCRMSLPAPRKAACSPNYRRCSRSSRCSMPRSRPPPWSIRCTATCRQMAASWCCSMSITAPAWGRSSVPNRRTCWHRCCRRRRAQFAVTVVGNAAEDASTDEARTVAAGASETQLVALGRLYPKDLYSLSHVALPFPLQDGLYGSEPSGSEDFGVRLGMVAVRGERGALIVGAETLMRASSNPFFDYMLERIEAGIPKTE